MSKTLHDERRRRRSVLLGVVGAVIAGAVVAVVLASLGRVLQASPAEPGPADTAAAETGAAAGGPAAPAFTLQTLEGETFTLADHRGKVVVVEFLAPGCPSCTVDLAGLAKATEQKANASLLVADVSGDQPDALSDFYRDQLDVPPEVLIAPDRDYKVTEAYGATALGDTVVITPDGTVSWKGRWAGDQAQLFAQIDKAARS